MERLTKKELLKTQNGKEIIGCNYKDEDCDDSCMYGYCKWNDKALKKLKEYEDMEEQVMKSTGVDIASMVGEFMHYYNLKKEGRLVELPCKPEDKLYWLSDEGYRYEPIEEVEVVDFVYNGYSIQMYFADKGEKDFLPLSVETIGNELFFTRKEAEAALKEMSKDCTDCRNYWQNTDTENECNGQDKICHEFAEMVK